MTRFRHVGLSTRRDAEGCESPWIPLDNKAFLGSAVPERPSCIVIAATRHRFGSPAKRQARRFCGTDSTVPEKEFLPGAAGKVSLRCEPARVKVSCGRGTCARIKTFRFGANIQKIQITNERIFVASITHRIYLVFSMGGMGCRDLYSYCSGIVVGTNLWSSVG